MIDLEFRALNGNRADAEQAILSVIHAVLSARGLGALLEQDDDGYWITPDTRTVQVADLGEALAAVAPELPLVGSIRGDARLVALTAAPSNPADPDPEEDRPTVAWGLNLRVSTYDNEALEGALAGLISGAFAEQGEEISVGGRTYLRIEHALAAVELIVGSASIKQLRWAA